MTCYGPVHLTACQARIRSAISSDDPILGYDFQYGRYPVLAVAEDVGRRHW